MNLAPPLEDLRRALEREGDDIQVRMNVGRILPTSVRSEYYIEKTCPCCPSFDSTHQNLQMELEASFTKSIYSYLCHWYDSVAVNVTLFACRDDLADDDPQVTHLHFGGPEIHCTISFKNAEKKNFKREFYIVQITKGREYHEYDHKYCSWRCVSEVVSGVTYSMDNTEETNPWYSDDSYCVINAEENVREEIELILKDLPETDIPLVVEDNLLLAARRSQEFVCFIMMRVSGEGIETEEHCIHTFKWFLYFDWRREGSASFDHGFMENQDVQLESVDIAKKYPNINNNQFYYSICKSTGQYKIEKEPLKMTL